MACNSCKKTPCTCNAVPTTTVVMPTGDPECDGSATNPCPPQQCCNYYDLIAEGAGLSAIWSAGGPFCLPLPEFNPFCYNGDCPGCDPPPLDLGDNVPNGATGVLCFDLSPGTYRVSVRAEVRGLLPGAKIAAVYRPDCGDATKEILILGHNEVATGCATPLDERTISGELFVEVDGCNPGVRILAIQGCQLPGGGACPSGGTIDNLQVSFQRQSGELRVNCTQSPLVDVVLDNPCTVCGDPPAFVGATALDATTGLPKNAVNATNIAIGSDITLLFSKPGLVVTVDVLATAADQDPATPCTAGNPIAHATTVTTVGTQTQVVLNPNAPLPSNTRIAVSITVMDSCNQQVNATFCFVTGQGT